MSPYLCLSCFAVMSEEETVGGKSHIQYDCGYPYDCGPLSTVEDGPYECQECGNNDHPTGCCPIIGTTCGECGYAIGECECTNV